MEIIKVILTLCFWIQKTIWSVYRKANVYFDYLVKYTNLAVVAFIQMKNRLLTAFFLSIAFYKSFCQVEKTTTQFGLSGLPVFDVFGSLPENNIQGLALTGNFGYFPAQNLSFGMMPYYAQATNTYPVMASDKETQNIKLYGLNTYLRYYFLCEKSCRLFSVASAGFGNSQQKTTSANSLALTRDRNEPTVTFQLGAGINYMLAKKIAVEFIIPYTYVKYISSDPAEVSFQTVLPTIGLQFFLK